MDAVESGPEKAGVGGSTPSLATIIPKNLAQIWRPVTGEITHGRSPTLVDEVLSGFLVQAHRFDHLCPSLHALVHIRGG